MKLAALSRWKLEALAGLRGYRALKHHQSETEKNQSAENAMVRSKVWGATEVPQSEEDTAMGDHIILGNNTHPTPVIFNQSGVGKVLAGAALAAGLIGIPAAGLIGYGLSKILDKPATVPQSEDNNLDIGLGRLEDLFPPVPVQ